MLTGSVVRLVRNRGFGFIRQESGQEIFFHATDVKGATAFDYLQEGQRVSFTLENDTRGRGQRAVDVQVVD